MAQTFDISLVNAMESTMQANYHIMTAITNHRSCDSDTMFELKKLMEANNIHTKILSELMHEKGSLSDIQQCCKAAAYCNTCAVPCGWGSSLDNRTGD